MSYLEIFKDIPSCVLKERKKEESGLDPEKVESIRRASFDFFRKNFSYEQNPEWQSAGFRDKRYCSDDDWIFTGSGEILHGYEGLLPRYKEKTAAEWLSEKCLQIRDRKVRVLDVGCGEGKALVEMVIDQEWKNRLDLYGLAAGFEEKVCRWLIENYGIKIKIGDAQRLGEVFPGEKFDLVFANWSVFYMADQFGVLEQIWQALEMGGIGLINGFFYPEENKGEIKEINSYLKRNCFDVFLIETIDRKTNWETGEKFVYLQVVMEKNKEEQLRFPLVPVGVAQFESGYPPLLVYRFKK